MVRDNLGNLGDAGEFPIAKAIKPSATFEIIEKDLTFSSLIKPSPFIPILPRQNGPIKIPATR